MENVVVVALISLAGAVLVAATNGAVQIFGPPYWEGRRAQQQRWQQQQDQLIARAEEFLAALANWSPDSLVGDRGQRQAVVAARQRLVAAAGAERQRPQWHWLRRRRPVRLPADMEHDNLPKFTTWLVLAIEREGNRQVRTLYIDGAAERIFASLRGNSSSIGPLPFTPNRDLLRPAEGPLAGDLF